MDIHAGQVTKNLNIWVSLPEFLNPVPAAVEIQRIVHPLTVCPDDVVQRPLIKHLFVDAPSRALAGEVLPYSRRRRVTVPADLRRWGFGCHVKRVGVKMRDLIF